MAEQMAAAHEVYAATESYALDVEAQERERVARLVIDDLTRALEHVVDAGGRMTQCYVDLHDYREQLRTLVQRINRGDDDEARASDAWRSLDGAVMRSRAEDADTAAFYDAPPFDDDERDEEGGW